jgi:hypothetical protein
MSPIITLLGVIVALTGSLAPLVSQLNPKIGLILTIVGVGAASVGRELVKPEALKNFFGSNKSKFPVVIIGLVLLSACGDVGTKVVKYSDKATRTIKRLRDEKVIEAEDAERILPLVADVRAVGVEYASIEQAIKEAKTEGNKQSLREQLRMVAPKITASLGRLEQEGVMRIKNEETRQKVRKSLVFVEIMAELVT